MVIQLLPSYVCTSISSNNLFNALNPIHHRNPSIVLNSLINDEIYTEIIGDFIHLSKDILKLLLKAKPIDKIILIRDSLPCAHYDKNIIFCNKLIAPNGKDERGTLAGSNKTIDEIAKKLDFYILLKLNIL